MFFIKCPRCGSKNIELSYQARWHVKQKESWTTGLVDVEEITLDVDHFTPLVEWCNTCGEFPE